MEAGVVPGRVLVGCRVSVVCFSGLPGGLVVTGGGLPFAPVVPVLPL